MSPLKPNQAIITTQFAYRHVMGLEHSAGGGTLLPRNGAQIMEICMDIEHVLGIPVIDGIKAAECRNLADLADLVEETAYVAPVITAIAASVDKDGVDCVYALAGGAVHWGSWAGQDFEWRGVLPPLPGAPMTHEEEAEEAARRG